MDPILDYEWLLTRRHFLDMASTGVGVAALATLFNKDLLAQTPASPQGVAGLPGLQHFAPTAKRVIYLFQSGAPSQHELFDYKPRLAELSGTQLPPSVRGNQRLTTMTAAQERLPIVPSVYKFAQQGQTASPPCPNLRSDEVEDWNARPLESFRQAEVKVGEIYQHRQRRPPFSQGPAKETESLPNARQTGEHFGQTDHCDLVSLHQSFASSGLHFQAAAAKKMHRAQPLAQSPDQERSIQVSGSLPGGNEDGNSGRHGILSARNRSPDYRALSRL